MSCSQSFQARLHGAILTPLVMEARSAVHQGGDAVSLGFYLQFKIVGLLSSPLSARERQSGSDGRRGRGQASSHRSLRRSTHLETAPRPHGTFLASHLFSWIPQSERPTENNRYLQLVVHLGNAGAVPVNVHHEPFQRRRGGFKRCQLCQSDN